VCPPNVIAFQTDDLTVVANQLLSDTRPRVHESGRNQPLLGDVHDRVSEIVTVVTAAGA
jgi:hypothetical protein